MERTFIAVKPDGVQRGLCGEIIKRFETRGFKMVAAKFLQASEDHLKQHYLDLKDMPFYGGLCKYMSSGPILAMLGFITTIGSIGGSNSNVTTSSSSGGLRTTAADTGTATINCNIITNADTTSTTLTYYYYCLYNYTTATINRLVFGCQAASSP
uniref:Nucleoside diphosphate kinase B n=1 Tax=Amphiprion ocellaris TaxID=80972 RepID=A0AAQ5ZFU8_AMPOC